MIPSVTEKFKEADVLVIGAGLAGSFASIKAAEAGARVVTWEKASAVRSGGAGGGLLNWHGVTPRDVNGKEMIDSVLHFSGAYLAGGQDRLSALMDKNFTAVLVRHSWDRLLDLERWGVNFRREDGQYDIVADPVTGLKTDVRIHSRGQMKKALYAQLFKAGVQLFNRTMAVDLLTHDGAVVGATGINVRTGEFVVCRARATIIATTLASRAHHAAQVGAALGKYKMIYSGWPPDSGDGNAMAFRAGAELVNMEVPAKDALRMYEHDTFFGKLSAVLQCPTPIPIVNAKGERVGGRHLRMPEWLKEDEAGRTPCYMDATGLPEEIYKFLEESRYDELPLAARLWKERGLDWRKDKFEMPDYVPYSFTPRISGILVDLDTRTNLRGLFAAGTGASFAGVCCASGSCVFGAIAGENAATYAKKSKKPDIDESQVRVQKESVFAPLKLKDGVEPLELEMKLRDITARYCGINRNEAKLNQGLWRLNSVRDRFFPEMIATNPHELMSVQEIKNLYVIGELQLTAARERKESGAGFFRRDYPEKTDAPWESAIVLRQEDGMIKTERRKMPELKA